MTESHGQFLAKEHSNVKSGQEAVRGRRPTQSSILAEARRIFARDLLEVLSPGGVVLDSGLSANVVRAYFYNKDDLLLAQATGELSRISRVMAKAGVENDQTVAQSGSISDLSKMIATFVAARNSSTNADGEVDVVADLQDADQSTHDSLSRDDQLAVAQDSKNDEAVPTEPKNTVEQDATSVRENTRAKKNDGVVTRKSSRILRESASDQPAECDGQATAIITRLERRVYAMERSLVDRTQQQKKELKKGAGKTGSADQSVDVLARRLDLLKKNLTDSRREYRSNLKDVSSRVWILEERSPAGPSTAQMLPESSDELDGLDVPGPDEESPSPETDTTQSPQEENYQVHTFLAAARQAAKETVTHRLTEHKFSWASLIRHIRRSTTAMRDIAAQPKIRFLLTRVAPLPLMALGLVAFTSNLIDTDGVRSTPNTEETMVAPDVVVPMIAEIIDLPDMSPFERLIEAASTGDADAEAILGLSYLNGTGVDSDEAEAFLWLHASADHGQAIAQYTLATLYARPDNALFDPILAKHWREAAAERGNRMAMNDLAVSYAEGFGTEQNPAEAAHWFSLAATLGFNVAQFNLAVLYERGDGVLQDLSEAYIWYAIASAQGDQDAKERADYLAARLDSDILASAQEEADSFTPAPMDHAANFTLSFSDWQG